MFKSLLGTDFFKIVSDDANDGIIKNDRLSYKPIFDMIRTEIIEDSTKNNSLHND